MLTKNTLIFSLLLGGFLSGSVYAGDKSDSSQYFADKWYNASAERNAVYREIYFMAENVIRAQVESSHLKAHQWGIVMDIDETVLNNSNWGYRHNVLKDPQSWDDFATQAISIPTPGAKKFMSDIHKMGGYINLVSNRSNTLLSATIKNLKSQGLYFDQVLCDATNTGTSFVDKNGRFTAIVKGTSPSKLPAQIIVGWFGDNIQDFPHLFQAKMIKKNPNGSVYNQFGVTYFALPNPTYGSWQANSFY